jgi:hypothetical protein
MRGSIESRSLQTVLGGKQMCDYSLMSMPTRLAVGGEELVVNRFPTGSLGFGPSTERPRGFWAELKQFFAQVPVVCIPPGARLMLRDIPARLQSELGLDREEEVVFTQLSATVNSYRDAVRFRNGKETLLQDLIAGQHARVLDLSGDPARSEIEQFSFQSPNR